MKFLESLLLVALFTALLVSGYIFWSNITATSVNFEEYRAESTPKIIEKITQFYPNMRYRDKKIAFQVSNACSQKNREDFIKATNILATKTGLNFYQSAKPEITVVCSQISPKPEQKNYFIAGEGGPSEIINATRYAIILSGQISLYRTEKCDNPQIALHELLHALGFNHTNDKNSIMYPVTDCEQKLDDYIINEIKNLYSQESAGDLLIETVTANKTGRYLNFEITIENNGLQDISSSSISVIAKGEKIKTFDTENLNVGAKKKLSVTNLQIPRNIEEITFQAETSESEITKSNNQVTLSIK